MHFSVWTGQSAALCFLHETIHMFPQAAVLLPGPVWHPFGSQYLLLHAVCVIPSLKLSCISITSTGMLYSTALHYARSIAVQYVL